MSQSREEVKPIFVAWLMGARVERLEGDMWVSYPNYKQNNPEGDLEGMWIAEKAGAVPVSRASSLRSLENMVFRLKPKEIENVSE